MELEELLYINVLGKQKCWGGIGGSIQTSSTLTALSCPISLSHGTASGFSLSHVSVDWLANIMLLNMNENRFLRTSVCWLVRHNKRYKRREYEERTFLRDQLIPKLNWVVRHPYGTPSFFFFFFVSMLGLSFAALRFQSVPTQERSSVSLFEI